MAKNPSQVRSKKSSTESVPVRTRISAAAMVELQKAAGPRGSIPQLVARAVDDLYLAENHERRLEVLYANQLRLETRSRKGELRHQILLETLLIFIRQYLVNTPELPAGEMDAATAAAEKRINRLMDVVARTVGTNASIIGRSTDLTELLYDTPSSTTPDDAAAPGPASVDPTDETGATK